MKTKRKTFRRSGRKEKSKKEFVKTAMPADELHYTCQTVTKKEVNQPKKAKRAKIIRLQDRQAFESEGPNTRISPNE